MRDLGLALIILGLVTLAAAVLARVTRTRPPGRHEPSPPDEAGMFVAELRGQPWPDAPRPGHPAQTMVPLLEPLEPLPTPDTPAPGRLADMGAGPDNPGSHEPAGAGALFAEAGGEIDQMVEDVRQRFGLGKPLAPPPRAEHESLLERYERLIPDHRPGYWVEATSGHSNNEALVSSILHRALSPELLARLDEERALSNGQVPGG